ncbi:MAG: membrane protein insertase YidC [Magnetococcales bacterium]|nr:membrane protein insertase YidC [Magnetococcales bacterium]NGZ06372.1 membrane protein insertase YidC [Magnetococcales bacterium]
MDQRNLLAITLSFVLLVVYQTISEIYFAPPPTAVEQSVQENATPEQKTTQEQTPAQPPPPQHAQARIQDSDNPKEQQFEFTNNVLHGQISNLGATISQVKLLKHFDQLPPAGKPIEFMSASGPNLFFEESGFLGEVGVELPNRKTLWNRVGSGPIGPNAPLTLVWDNGKGLKFEKKFIFQPGSYLIQTTDRVVNATDKPLTLFHFSHFARIEPKLTEQQAMAVSDFEGPMGYLDNMRVQHPYEELKKQDQRINAQEGWAGYSDKYFLAAVVPDQTGMKKFYFDYDEPTHRIGMVSAKQELAAGASLERSTQLYIGPKEVRTLEASAFKLERAMDYGWFHFLAVPLVEILLFFNDFLHNYGMAIIMLTVIIKLLFFPLATKSYRSMNAMKKLAPKMEELKKLYAHDKAMLQQETMRMYQENKVNPLGGCLPIVVQIPVFFALYKVLFLSVEMRQAPWILWIDDLSVMDPYYVLPLLMGATMFIQTKMNPAPADPVQAKVMLFLPVIFTVMFLSFPAGLVLYWLVNNVLSIAQQGYIMKMESK